MSGIRFEVKHKTIYTDIVSMPDPMLLAPSIHYYNHMDSTVYFKLYGSGTNWSSNSVAMGSLATGTSNYYLFDNFMSRTKPTSAVTEQITLTLKGYSDAGYTIQVAEYQRLVTVIFIKSDDGTWTTDDTDNFDDGTVMGWTGRSNRGEGYGTVTAQTDYALSSPYSLRQYGWDGYLGYKWWEMYKSFTTPDRNTVYLIVNMRVYGTTHEDQPSAHTDPDYAYVAQGGTILTRLGGQYTIPESKWLRIVIPLTSNVTQEITIRNYVNMVQNHHSMGQVVYIWIDDIKIISKNV